MLKDSELIIFYADDDPDDLDFFREVAASISEKLSVVTHENGAELMAALENPPPVPYVVFLDINMPGYTGIDVLERVRGKQEYDHLPIVIFSTSSDSEIIEQTRRLGANFYLTKSSDFIQLKHSILHTLNINWPTFKPGPKDFVYAA